MLIARQASLVLLILVLSMVVFSRFAYAAGDEPAVGSESAGVSAAENAPEIDYNQPPIQPNLQMFLATLVIFGGLIFLTTQHSWKPLIQGLNDRESRVVNAERNAHAARNEVKQLKRESEVRLAEVQEQVKALMAKARAEAEAQKREIIAMAEHDAQRIKEDALRAIAEAQSAAIQNLDQFVDEQVGLATEHVVGRRL